MNLLRIIIFAALGYFFFKIIKRFLLGTQAKAHEKKHDKKREENIQDKHADNIEDADFEELE